MSVLRRCITVILLIFTVIFLVPTWAKAVNLYDAPEANAKIIGTIDLTKGIVPIFTSKSGDWVKVGDPNNGNVGWIKTSDVSDDKTPVTFNQKVIKTDNGTQTIQSVQYGSGAVSDKQTQEIEKQLKAQQAIMQQAIQNMVNNLNVLYQYGDPNKSRQIPAVLPAKQNTTQQSVEEKK